MNRLYRAPSLPAPALLTALLTLFPALSAAQSSISLAEGVLPIPKVCGECARLNKDFTAANERLHAALGAQAETVNALEELKKRGSYGKEFDDAVEAVKSANKEVSDRRIDFHRTRSDLNTVLSQHLQKVEGERTIALQENREARLEHASAAYKYAAASLEAEAIRKSIAEGPSEDGKFKPYPYLKNKVDLTAIVDDSIALERQGKGPSPILENILKAGDGDPEAADILLRDFKAPDPAELDIVLEKNAQGETVWDEKAIQDIQDRSSAAAKDLEGPVETATTGKNAADRKAFTAEIAYDQAKDQEIQLGKAVKETEGILKQEIPRVGKVLAEAEKERADKEKVHEVLGITPGSGGDFDGTGDPGKAKDYLDRVLARDPNNPEARSARALANSKLGNDGEACDDAQAALRGNPGDRRAFGIMKLSCPAGTVAPNPSFGASPGERGGYPGGGMFAADTPPRWPSASGGGGSPGHGPGGPGMMTAPRGDVPRNVRDSFALTKKAQQMLSQRDLDGAIAALDQAIEINPGNAGAYYMRAMAFNGKGEYRQGLADASAGLRLMPGNQQLLNALAFAQNKTGDFRGALMTAERAVQGNPKDAMAYANLAFARGMLGDRGDMLAALRKAAALDPRFDASLRSAMEAPPDGEFPFLFPGEGPPKEAAKTGGKGGLKKLLLVFFLTLIIIGLLAALYPLRAKIRDTIRGTQVPVSTPSAAIENTPSDLPGMTPSPGGAAPAAGGARMTQGTVLASNYVLGEKIGEGGMGAVFKAYDRKLDRPVAMKKMLPELRNSPREMERFINEAKIVSHISHPYIVGIHDILNQDGDVFLVFDFVDGKPLSGIIDEKGRLPLADCRTYFSQICQAVAHAHAHNVLHRDLKPANIMIDKAGFAKVMDFGIAREAKQSISRLTHKDTSGTPVYMAPEQHLGEAGKPADIFALGVCLYEAMTGELPFKGPDFLAQKERMRFAPPSKLVPGLPKIADVLITAALAAEPGKRISDAGELKDSLEKLV